MVVKIWILPTMEVLSFVLIIKGNSFSFIPLLGFSWTNGHPKSMVWSLKPDDSHYGHQWFYVDNETLMRSVHGCFVMKKTRIPDYWAYCATTRKIFDDFFLTKSWIINWKSLFFEKNGNKWIYIRWEIVFHLIIQDSHGKSKILALLDFEPIMYPE